MKNRFLIILFFTLCLRSVAQPPQAINYQGVARDSIGYPLINGSISLRLSILDSSATGQTVYTETHSTQTNSSGLFNIYIGSGTVLYGSFSVIPWERGSKWLKVEMDLNNANNYQLIGVTQFLSVPYALNAGNGNFNKTGYDIYNSNIGNVGIGTNSPDPSAQVEIKSNSKGFLPPRMSLIQRNAISNAAIGLILWCTDCGVSGELQIFNGTAWTNILGGASQINLVIGQFYQGGKIAYLLQSGDSGFDQNVPHGIIAALFDQSISTSWYLGNPTTTNATLLALGTGNNNTNTIVTSQGPGNYAAKLCFDLVLNGYDDWFLPSKDELHKLFLNKLAIGGFSNNKYWSSSEDNINYTGGVAWAQDFSNGQQGNYYGAFFGGWSFYVRAVRTF